MSPTPAISYDARRPLPLGLPTREEVLAAICAQREVVPALESSHVRVLALFPEYLFDEARTSLVGAASPAALAAASAWRGVVAAERIDGAPGFDVAAVLALIDELVVAREHLVGLSAFALDGGEGAQELISTVDECVGRFVVLARHQGKAFTPSAVAAGDAKLLSMATAPRALLPRVLAASVLLALTFHVGRFVLEQRAAAGWVVVGDVDGGRAFLAPAGPDSDEGARARLVAKLELDGISVTPKDGRWVLTRVAKREAR